MSKFKFSLGLHNLSLLSYTVSEAELTCSYSFRLGLTNTIFRKSCQLPFNADNEVIQFTPTPLEIEMTKELRSILGKVTVEAHSSKVISRRGVIMCNLTFPEDVHFKFQLFGHTIVADFKQGEKYECIFNRDSPMLVFQGFLVVEGQHAVPAHVELWLCDPKYSTIKISDVQQPLAQSIPYNCKIDTSLFKNAFVEHVLRESAHFIVSDMENYDAAVVTGINITKDNVKLHLPGTALVLRHEGCTIRISQLFYDNNFFGTVAIKETKHNIRGVTEHELKVGVDFKTNELHFEHQFFLNVHAAKQFQLFIKSHKPVAHYMLPDVFREENLGLTCINFVPSTGKFSTKISVTNTDVQRKYQASYKHSGIDLTLTCQHKKSCGSVLELSSNSFLFRREEETGVVLAAPDEFTQIYMSKPSHTSRVSLFVPHQKISSHILRGRASLSFSAECMMDVLNLRKHHQLYKDIVSRIIKCVDKEEVVPSTNAEHIEAEINCLDKTLTIRYWELSRPEYHNIIEPAEPKPREYSRQQRYMFGYRDVPAENGRTECKSSKPQKKKVSKETTEEKAARRSKILKRPPRPQQTKKLVMLDTKFPRHPSMYQMFRVFLEFTLDIETGDLLQADFNHVPLFVAPKVLFTSQQRFKQSMRTNIAHRDVYVLTKQ